MDSQIYWNEGLTAVVHPKITFTVNCPPEKSLTLILPIRYTNSFSTTVAEDGKLQTNSTAMSSNMESTKDHSSISSRSRNAFCQSDPAPVAPKKQHAELNLGQINSQKNRRKDISNNKPLVMSKGDELHLCRRLNDESNDPEGQITPTFNNSARISRSGALKKIAVSECMADWDEGIHNDINNVSLQYSDDYCAQQEVEEQEVACPVPRRGGML